VRLLAKLRAIVRGGNVTETVEPTPTPDEPDTGDGTDDGDETAPETGTTAE
jgi:hypothetical protein